MMIRCDRDRRARSIMVPISCSCAVALSFWVIMTLSMGDRRVYAARRCSVSSELIAARSEVRGLLFRLSSRTFGVSTTASGRRPFSKSANLTAAARLTNRPPNRPLCSWATQLPRLFLPIKTMLELHDGGSVCFIFIPGKDSIATVVETIEFAINPLLPQFRVRSISSSPHKDARVEQFLFHMEDVGYRTGRGGRRRRRLMCEFKWPKPD